MEKNLSFIFKINLLVICCAFAGCAWNLRDGGKFPDKQEPSPDLVVTFAQEKDIIKKFQEDTQFSEDENKTIEIVKKQVQAEEKKAEAKKVIEEAPTMSSPGVGKPVLFKKIAEEPKPVSVELAPEDIKELEAQSIKTKYPVDYPEDYKAYDQKSEKIWKEFVPKVFIGEKMVFDVKYFNVTAGKIFLETKPIKKIGTRKAFHFYGRMISAPFYEMIYNLDDYVESFMDIETYIPIKYALIQRETKQDIDDLELIDTDKLKTYFWFKKVKDEVVKDEKMETFVPRYLQDSLSPIFFMRGLPFIIGRVYEFPVVTRAKVWMVKIEVQSLEKIKVQDKWEEAYRLKVETRFPGVLSKKGDIIFWYSSDAKKRFLKFEAKVKIGSIDGELVDYELPE